MSLIDVLSSYLCRVSYDDLSEAVVSGAKARVIDFWGGALWGYTHGIHKPVMEILGKCIGNGESTVIGEGVKLQCKDTAFMNSCLCSVTDLADGSRFAGLHPSPVVIPAALAALETKAKIEVTSGKDLILSIALGYEVMIRIGRAINPSTVKRGFHLTSVVGPFGATAAVAKIMHLDYEKMVNAMSIAALMGSGLLEAFKAPEPFVELQVARASEAGILSVMLAQAGVKGNNLILEESFIPAFSDEHNLDLIDKDLGKDYMLPKTYIKMHGGCRHIHVPIDAVLYLVKANQIDWRDIEQIKIKTYSLALNSDVEHPKTEEDTKFSVAFGIAVALIRGDAFLDKFTMHNLKDKRVQELMGKVLMEHNPEFDKEYPAKRAATLEIRTNGRLFSHTLYFAKGEPEYPHSRSEIEEKFRRLVIEAISEEKAQEIIDLVNRLETVGEITNLFALFKAKK